MKRSTSQIIEFEYDDILINMIKHKTLSLNMLSDLLRSLTIVNEEDTELIQKYILITRYLILHIISVSRMILA